MLTRKRLWLALALVPALAGTVLFAPNNVARVDSSPIKNRVLQRQLDVALGKVRPAKWEMPVSAGVVLTLLEATGELDRRAEAAAKQTSVNIPGPPTTLGCSNVIKGNPLDNIRVNQDCSLRRQAEEVVAVNPTDPRNLIAGQNDSRVGFNHCGYDWSFDSGATWGDLIPPFYQYQWPSTDTADACSDPTVAFDSQGNAFVGGILFNILEAGSAIVVSRSDAGIGGRFFHSPNQADPFHQYSASNGVVASDENVDIFHDKELMTADANPASPKADNVYMTWTRFDSATGEGVGANSPIYFSQSTDGGFSWSPGVEISGSGPMCTDFSGSKDPNACDQDQGSHPVVGPNGDLYVIFGNGNTAEFGMNQVLFVRCGAAKDCRQGASWSDPVRINDLVGLHPLNDDAAADADTGCPAFRQCLPPNGYRVPEFTSMSLSVDGSSNLYAVWSDFRNGFVPPCDTLDTETSEPPCDNDVFYAFSRDGGSTWSAEVNVAPEADFGPTAQWQPWSAVTSEGRVLWIGYYDRSYGECEFTGCNDITLAKVRNPRSPAPTLTYHRVTTGSMPNLVPANNPLQAGFLGDYMWVAVDFRGEPYVVWADTRGRGGSVEEDVYFAH